MKRYLAIIIAVVFLLLSFTSVPVYAQDNILDKASDWWATRGKEDPEKSMILTQRRAERAAKRARKQMEKGSRQMRKDMKKAFGQ